MSNAKAATFSNGVVIPELAYFVFQMTFAMITPAPDRRRFRRAHQVLGGDAVHPALVTFIYFPIAHWVWYCGRSR